MRLSRVVRSLSVPILLFALSCQPSQRMPKSNRAAQDQEQEKQRTDEQHERDRIAAEQEQQRQLHEAQIQGAAQLAEEQRVEAQRKEESRKALEESCASDRSQRLTVRRLEDEHRAKKEQLIAYRKKNCRLFEGTVPITGDRLELDEDGYLVRERGVGVEVFWQCPAHGPEGARGRVVVGTRRAGDDRARVARLRSSATSTSPSRDEICKEADEAAAQNR